MYSIDDKRTTLNYIPDVFLTLSKAFYEKFNDFFSYKIIYLYPNKSNVKEIKDIIEFKLCPNYKHKMYYMNCFNPIDNLKVTFIRVCHRCNQMFLLSGRYNTKIMFERAFKFFIEPKERRNKDGNM